MTIDNKIVITIIISRNISSKFMWFNLIFAYSYSHWVHEIWKLISWMCDIFVILKLSIGKFPDMHYLWSDYTYNYMYIYNDHWYWYSFDMSVFMCVMCVSSVCSVNIPNNMYMYIVSINSVSNQKAMKMTMIMQSVCVHVLNVWSWMMGFHSPAPDAY